MVFHFMKMKISKKILCMSFYIGTALVSFLFWKLILTKSNTGGKRVYLAYKSQVSVHHIWEVKVGIEAAQHIVSVVSINKYMQAACSLHITHFKPSL